jgi:hypothetical protein
MPRRHNQIIWALYHCPSDIRMIHTFVQPDSIWAWHLQIPTKVLRAKRASHALMSSALVETNGLQAISVLQIFYKNSI